MRVYFNSSLHIPPSYYVHKSTYIMHFTEGLLLLHADTFTTYNIISRPMKFYFTEMPTKLLF